ncbi:uncharacterized protein LOC117581210 [Drosophila guanche]|uniref:uncharacterized protein LOC117581210 n=1 Tax=Drosophila guanche TaxID=7266 RepID=UPI001471E4B0|nr:uncharacterized protein LOC117581210 [Drosophila guanche]
MPVPVPVPDRVDLVVVSTAAGNLTHRPTTIQPGIDVNVPDRPVPPPRTCLCNIWANQSRPVCSLCSHVSWIPNKIKWQFSNSQAQQPYRMPRNAMTKKCQIYIGTWTLSKTQSLGLIKAPNRNYWQSISDTSKQQSPSQSPIRHSSLEHHADEDHTS